MKTMMSKKFTNLSFVLLLFVIILQPVASLAEMIAYDPFVNANVANGANDKLNGEYNAGTQFRDFTNGNNKDVASGQEIHTPPPAQAS